MVVIKEFHPCQRDYVFKYAEQKRIEKEIETKISEFKESLQPENSSESISESTNNSNAGNTQKTRSLISSTIDFKLFLQETERHLIEAKQFGHQLTSIHNAVQDLNNLKSSELLQRLRAGNAMASEDVKVSGPNKVERYANGTIIEDETVLHKRRMSTPLSIASLEEYKLHGRIRTADFQNYHLSNRDKKFDHRNVRHSQSLGSCSSSSDNGSQCKLPMKAIRKRKKSNETPEIIDPKASFQHTSHLQRKTPRIPACPPKVQEMLDQVKQRKCTSNCVAFPISVLNLKLV